MSDSTNNIDKLHTTTLGAKRIKQNLNLQTDDVVAWCKDAVLNADLRICQGKNWYAYKNGVVVTVNAKSLTIITAHRLNAKIRVMEKGDYPVLNEFLYQAIFVPKGVKPPSRDIIYEKNIYAYIKNFGCQKGDLGVVALQNGQIIGAAWTRIIPAYGHVDELTPELAVSLFPEFRGFGIGTKLMKKLFGLLCDNGYERTSLSVQTDNPAVGFYKKLGYKIIAERPDGAGHQDYLMIKNLQTVKKF